MLFTIPIWARLVIRLAWGALKGALERGGVPLVVIQTIEEVMRQLGVLGVASLTHTEVVERARGIQGHCSGVACAPELKV